MEPLLLSGLSPVAGEPNRRSSFACALDHALFYAGDGRAFDELMAATRLPFCWTTTEDGTPGGEVTADLGFETLTATVGTKLRYLELATADLATTQPSNAWQLMASHVEHALNQRRPVLARGCWEAPLATNWGLICGMDAAGMPQGFPHAHQERTQTTRLARPPWQLVMLAGDEPRPGVRQCVAKILAMAAAALAGEQPPVDRLGQRWVLGPTALERWANHIEHGSEPIALETSLRDLIDRRRWGARYMTQRAIPALASRQSLRTWIQQWCSPIEALADWVDAPHQHGSTSCAALIRNLADIERNLGMTLAHLVGE
jgi:hypothetical protein